MTVDYNSKAYLDKVDAWWRAANYISAAQMYLKDNPLLKREVVENDLKAHPIGHWGTVPGQNFIYAHLNRAINKYDLDMFYIEGPGHGGQVMVLFLALFIRSAQLRKMVNLHRELRFLRQLKRSLIRD